MRLTVLMSVHSKESPQFLRECLESLAQQTHACDELVIVEDGPLGPNLDDVIGDYRIRMPIVSVPIGRKVGLDEALRHGLARCNGTWIARMDSDDICIPERFALQTAYLASHPEIDALGGAIAEFGRDVTDLYSLRRLPTSGDALARYAKWRSPINNVTVIFKRAAVLDAGGYVTCLGFEDYHLWARMLLRGCRLHNLDDVLVYVRCGNGMVARRGGFAYARQEVRNQRVLYDLGFLSAYEMARNVALRAPVRLLPSFLRGSVYRRLLRKPAGTHPMRRVYPTP
jgi:O104-antigen biosynthesis beta-1,3-galactosyltransferase